jgi:hypothetical protein
MATEVNMKSVEITFTGTRPLLMHNGRMALPLDPHTKALKEITGKRKKTEADLEEIARREWIGSLYYDDELGPYLPGENLEKCLVEGARKHKLGTYLQQGFQVEDDIVALEYDGPRDLDGMKAAGERFWFDAGVKQGQGRVQKRRPLFRQWSLRFTGTYDPTVCELDYIMTAAITAGARVGIGDWRPRYGRFDAKVAE